MRPPASNSRGAGVLLFSGKNRQHKSPSRIHPNRSNIYKEMRFAAEIPVSLPGVASRHDFA